MENSRFLAAVCLQICPYLMLLSLSHPQKKRRSQLHLLPGKAKLTDEWRFWQQRDRKWERKPERERRGTRKWNVIGSHTRSNLATCQSTSCLIRRRSEAPGRRAVSQGDTLRFMNGASRGPAARYTCPFNHGSKRIYFDGTLLLANVAWEIEDRERRTGECWIRLGRKGSRRSIESHSDFITVNSGFGVEPLKAAAWWLKKCPGSRP